MRCFSLPARIRVRELGAILAAGLRGQAQEKVAVVGRDGDRAAGEFNHVTAHEGLLQFRDQDRRSGRQFACLFPGVR